jgi:hypothetical protein
LEHSQLLERVEKSVAPARLDAELVALGRPVEALATALIGELDKAARDPEYLAAFRTLHETLRRDADARAAEAVAMLLRPATERLP